MAAGLPGLCEVADLILLKARRFQAIEGMLIHRPFLFGLREDQLARVNAPFHRCAILHDQAVAGEMLRRQRKRAVQRIGPHGHRLPGDAQHQVDIEIIKASPAGKPHRLLHLGPGVLAVQEFQLLRVSTLRAQGKPVDAAVSKSCQKARGEGARVGLAADLGVPCQEKIPVQGIKYPGHLLGLQKAGRAPADKDRVDSGMSIAFGPGVQLRDQCIHIRRAQPHAAFKGRKIAVAALFGAEGHMNIKPRMGA